MSDHWSAPGVIVQQFTSLWDAPLDALRKMEAHQQAKVDATTDKFDRIVANMVLSTIQEEIARKERVAARAAK